MPRLLRHRASVSVVSFERPPYLVAMHDKAGVLRRGLIRGPTGFNEYDDISWNHVQKNRPSRDLRVLMYYAPAYFWYTCNLVTLNNNLINLVPSDSQLRLIWLFSVLIRAVIMTSACMSLAI